MTIRKRPSKKAKNGYVFEVFITYQENGITQHHTKRGFETKKEAQEYETKKKAEIQENGKIKKEVKKTFEQVYYEFLQLGCDQYQYNTIRNTKNVFNMYLQKDIGKFQITSFDYATLQKYFNSIAEYGLARNKSIRKAIKRVLDFAVKMDYIKNNPIHLVTVKGVEVIDKKDHVISLQDFNTIIQDLEDIGDFKRKAYSIALQIALYTGLRISEVLALEKSDFDFDNSMIYINKKLNYQGLTKEEFYITHELKSKSSNAYIPLIDNLKIVLLKWFEINPYNKVVCDEQGYYLNPNVLSTDVKRLAKKRNIYFHFHMLRHTFATILVTSNVDIKTAQELMRHASFNTTLTLYTHINDEVKKNTLNDVFNSKCVKNVLNPQIELKSLS